MNHRTKTNLLVMSLVMHLFTNLCFTDRVLHAFNTDLEANTGVPKNWFKYVEVLVKSAIIQATKGDLSMPSYIHVADSFKRETHEIQSQNQTIQPTCQMGNIGFCSGTEVVYMFMGHIVSSSEQTRQNILNMTGSLNVQQAQIPLSIFFGKDTWYYFLKYIWQFSLTLSLNISFEQISFMFHSKYCQDDNLSIYPLNMKHNFTVCHKQSAFNLYPPSNRLSIVQRIFLYIHTHFAVCLMFAVVDLNIIATTPLPQSRQKPRYWHTSSS